MSVPKPLVKIISVGEHKPRRRSSLDAGIDIATQSDFVIKPGESLYMPAGVRFDFVSDRYYVNVVTRSSTLSKGLNITPTIVDASYPHEISIIATNITHDDVYVSAGSYLAQCVLHERIAFSNDDEFTHYHKARGVDDKFGSTDA